MALSLIGELYYKLTINSDKFNETLAEAKKKAKEFDAQWTKTAQGLSDVGGKMTTFLTLPILGIGAAMLKGASDMENYQTSFTTLLQDAGQASTMLTQLKTMAAATPFGFADLAQSSKTLLGFGQSASSVIPTMKMLGDISMGNKEKFQQLTLVYAQIQSTGKLMGQDLLQLINAGFNPLTIMSQQTGKSVAQLKDEMAKGAISADMVTSAFKAATSAGGLFAGGMQAASKTLSGQWSTLMDDLGNLGTQFGEILIPIAKDVIKVIGQVVTWFSSLDDGAKRMILTIGGIVAVIGPAAAAIGGIMTALTATNPIVLGVVAGIAVLVTVITALTAKSKEQIAAEKLANEQREKTLAQMDQLKQKANEGNKAAREEILTMLEKAKVLTQLNLGMGAASPIIDALNVRIAGLKKEWAALDAAAEQDAKNARNKANAAAQTEEQKEAAKLLKEFASERMTDMEREVMAVDEKRKAYLKAGADQVQVEEWAAAQIDNIVAASMSDSDQAMRDEVQRKRDALEKEVQDKKTAEDQKAALEKERINAGIQLAGSAVSQIGSIVAMGFQNELTATQNAYGEKAAAIDEEYETKKSALERSTMDEKRKTSEMEKLDKEYADKKTAVEKQQASAEADIKRKAFEANKAASIISAIISGVQAAMTIFAQFGWPWGLIPAGIMAGITAANIGMIASQPVPAFAESGTVMPRPGGALVRVAEGGEQEHIMGDSKFRQTLREELGRSNQITQSNNFYGDINSDVDLDRASMLQARRLRSLLRAS